MKIVLYCDKFLYRNLYMSFPKYNENNQIIGSLFADDEFDNFHVLNKDLINMALNPVDGIKDIYLLVLQKSWYSDPTCINIAKYFKLLHPESKLVFYFDEPVNKHSYLCNRLVNEELGFIATNIDELKTLVSQNFEIKQDNYLLPVLKKSTLKKLEKQYLNS